MGEIRLGVLLGAEDRAQSFDVASFSIGALGIGSWQHQTGSIYLVNSSNNANSVHSSDQGLVIETNSAFDYFIRYPIRADTVSRYGPYITQHTIRALAWGRVTTAQDSGRISLQLLLTTGEFNAGFPFNTILSRVEIIRTDVLSSGTFPLIDIDAQNVSSLCTLLLDDVLVCADEQVLTPNWELNQREVLLASRSTSLGGRSSIVRWGGYNGFTIPLDYVPSSVADLFHHWWRIQAPCLFTLDTSDENACWPVRIVNQQTPLGGYRRPYSTLRSGALELQSIHAQTLVF